MKMKSFLVVSLVVANLMVPMVASAQVTQNGQANQTSVKSIIEPNASILYHVEIKTSTVADAGTDANIKLTIKGSNGSAGPFALVDSNDSNQFEAGDVNNFYLSSLDLGELTGFTLSSDNSGYKPGWNVVYVTITNTSSNKSWTRNCNTWIQTGSLSQDFMF